MSQGMWAVMRFRGLGLEVEDRHLAELAEAVGGDEQLAAVFAEGPAEVDGLAFVAAGLGQHLHRLAGVGAVQVHQPQLGLVDADVARQRHALAVVADVAAEPAAAFQLHELAALGHGVLGFGAHGPEGGHDLGARAALGGAVDGHAAVHDLTLGLAPAVEGVALVGRGQQHGGLAVEALAVDLRDLVAAAGAAEDDVAAGLGLVAATACRLGALRHGAQGAQGCVQAEQLGRAGTGIAVADQHLGAGGVPVGEAVAAELGVGRHALGQGRGHGWDAFDVQGGRGRDEVSSRRLRQGSATGAQGQGQGHQQGADHRFHGGFTGLEKSRDFDHARPPCRKST